ncbi:hypothetical protein N9L68_08370 [bacterium]|nr:hypothetical protein [bacterium]
MLRTDLSGEVAFVACERAQEISKRRGLRSLLSTLGGRGPRAGPSTASRTGERIALSQQPAESATPRRSGGYDPSGAK